MHKRRDSQPKSWISKAVYLVVIGGLVVLGLIGLVLPIIPGLVFLGLALLLLAQISTRVHVFVGGYSWFRRMRRGFQRLTHLKPTDRVQLAFWYCVQAAVTGVESAVRFVSRQLGRS